MPLTQAGKKTKKAMKEHYGEEKGEEAFYRSENKGIPGSERWAKKEGKSTTKHKGHDSSHRSGKH